MSNLSWRCESCKKQKCVCGRHVMEQYCQRCAKRQAENEKLRAVVDAAREYMSAVTLDATLHAFHKLADALQKLEGGDSNV